MHVHSIYPKPGRCRRSPNTLIPPRRCRRSRFRRRTRRPRSLPLPPPPRPTCLMGSGIVPRPSRQPIGRRRRPGRPDLDDVRYVRFVVCMTCVARWRRCAGDRALSNGMSRSDLSKAPGSMDSRVRCWVAVQHGDAHNCIYFIPVERADGTAPNCNLNRRSSPRVGSRRTGGCQLPRTRLARRLPLALSKLREWEGRGHAGRALTVRDETRARQGHTRTSGLADGATEVIRL